jgi:hypothetical protein
MSEVNKHYTPKVSSMKALIIYDDLSSFAKANTALQYSEQNVDFSVLWNIRPWRVDMLKFPPTAEDALVEAMDAHLIVFVGTRVQSLPFWLQDWLEHWAKCRQIKDAALAVIGLGNTEVMLSLSDLSRFAKHHGLSVIFDDRDAIEESLFRTESLQKLKSDKSLFMPRTLDKRIQDSYRGWGINE